MRWTGWRLVESSEGHGPGSWMWYRHSPPQQHAEDIPCSFSHSTQPSLNYTLHAPVRRVSKRLAFPSQHGPPAAPTSLAEIHELRPWTQQPRRSWRLRRWHYGRQGVAVTVAAGAWAAGYSGGGPEAEVSCHCPSPNCRPNSSRILRRSVSCLDTPGLASWGAHSRLLLSSPSRKAWRFSECFLSVGFGSW